MEEPAPVAPAPDASGVTAPAAPVSSAPATPLPPADWKEVAADPWFQGLDAPGKAAAVSQWRDAWSGWGAAQKEAPEGWRDRLDAEANAFAQHAALKVEDFKGSETPPAEEAPAVSGEESPGALRGSLNAFARYMWNRPNEWAESGILPRFLGGSGGALGKADDARALRAAAEEQQALAERGFMTAENRAGAKAKREQAAALESEAAAEVSASARSRALAEEFFPKTDAERAVDRAKGFSETASTLAENPSAVLPWMAESAVPIAKGAATALLPGGWLAKAATASGIFGSDAYAATRAGEIVRAAQERGIDPENREAMLALLRDPKFLDEAERRANIAGAGAAAVGAVLPVSNLAGQAAERAVASGAKELVKVGAREVVREVAPGAARTAAAKAAGVVADAGVQGALGVAADTVEQLASEGEVDTGRLLRRGLTDALTGAAFRVAHGMGDGVEAAQAEKAALDARDRAIVDDFASRHGYDLTTKEWSGPEASVGDLASALAAVAKKRTPQKVTLRDSVAVAQEALSPEISAKASAKQEAPADAAPHELVAALSDAEMGAQAQREAQVFDSVAGLAEAQKLKPLERPHLSADEWIGTLTKSEVADGGGVAWDKIRDARKLDHASRIPELEDAAQAEILRRQRMADLEEVDAAAGFTLRDVLDAGDVKLPAGVDASRMDRSERSRRLGAELHALHKNLGNQGSWMRWVDGERAPSLDHTLEQLHELGFRQIEDINGLLDALDSTVRGGKVYPSERPRSMPLAAKRKGASSAELSLEGPRPYEAPWQPTEEEVRLYGDQRGLGERLAERVKDTKDDLVGFVRSNFTSRGAAPESVFNLKEFSQGQAVKTALRIGWADRDMRQAMKADGIPFDAESYRRINAALAGVESAKESLPKATRSALNEMRAIVDGVTAELVETGAVASGKMDVLEGNRGSYLHRSYRHFDDPSWAKKVPAHLKNRVAAVFMEEMPGLTKAEADGYVANLLHREDGPVAALARLGKREQSVLMKRSEIHPAVRAMWGEYEDPFVNFAKSVEKMSRLLEAHKLQVAIEKVGKGVFLFDTPGEKARHHVQVGGAERGAFAELAKARKAAMELSPNDEGGLSPVSSEDLQRSLGPLAKYYTTPEIAGLLRNLDNSADDTNKFMRAALKASGVSQYAKTVLSPVTHVRNMTGNVAIMLANGNWSPGGLSEASKAMVGMTKMSPKAWRERTARYAELGLIGESVSANILRETIRRAHVGERSAPGKFLEAVNKAYGMEDDFFKVYAFEGELAKLKQAFPERPLAELEAEAANVVKDTVPTFSRAPKAVAMLRRQPFIGNFVGFPAELTRTAMGTMARGIKELSTPGYREIGAKRLAAFIAVAAVNPMALQYASRRALGWNEDMERAAREFLPEYNRSSPVIWLGYNDGKFRVLSLDGTNPYSYFHKPVIQSLRLMLEGDPSAGTLEKAIVGFSEVMAPYTDERVLYGRINDVLRNSERLTGREIYNPTDPLSYKLKKGVGHVLAAFAPGAVDTGRRIAKAAAGVVEESGRTYDLKDEVNAALTGQRVTVVDVNKAVSGRFREFNTREAEALGPWRDAQKAVANGATETTAETLVKAWQDSQERRWREYSAMNRTAKAALTLNGGNRREVVQAMRDAKMGSAESASVLGGVFMPTLPDASNKDFAVRIATLPGGKEAMREILRRAIILKDKPLDKPMPETGR